MPRQNRRRAAPPTTVRGGGVSRREQWRGEDYEVRTVTGSAAGKAYRCPGCEQVLAPGAAHVVVWPSRDIDADGRRHWHSACWAARDRRVADGPRGRSAPRY